MNAERSWGTPEREWMAQALALGAIGEGATSPNPRVGCVLVRDGRVVGCGYHRAPGRAHAEAMALAWAGDLARGATLYVSLEPCSHHGRTPPCADLLVEAGVSRIVAGMQDPNPLVDGSGFDRLVKAGVQVEVGLLREDAARLNEPFIHWHRHGLPLVTLKAAVSTDGMLAARDGSARWITGIQARRFAHRLRLCHDAVLVGGGTVRRDDPRLTVRLPGVRAPRLRAVISESLDIDPGRRLFASDGGPTPRIYTSRERAVDGRSRFEGLADLVGLSRAKDGLDLRELLGDLGRQGVQSVMVEGGAKTFAGFLTAGLAHRAAVFLAARMMGSRGGTPMLDVDVVADPDRAWRVAWERQVPLGPDILLIGRIDAPPDEGLA